MMRSIKWQAMQLSSLVLLAGLMTSGTLPAKTTGATQDLTAATFNSELQDNGSIIISKGVVFITLINPDTAAGLGVDEATLNALLHILDKKKIQLADWPQKLAEVVENYQRLVAATDEIQSGSEALQSLKASAKRAVSDVDLSKAGILFNAIHSAKPVQPLTAAEADAANGARALTQLNAEEAADYYLRASSTIEKLGEKHHVKWSHYAERAGTAFRDAGFYNEANALLTTAFTLREKYVPGSQLMIDSLNKLAGVKRLMGNYDGALPLYQMALSSNEDNFGKHHAQVAIALNNIADIHRLTENYPEALPLYQRALEINRGILGSKHPDVATTLNNLAGLYEATSNFDQALEMYREALKVNESIYGEDHPNVATTLNNLAGLYRALGQHQTALPLYERDLKISRKILGKDHPDVATTLNNLGILYFHMEDYAKSADYLEQALVIFRSKLGLDHPNTFSVEESLAVISDKLAE